MSQPVAFKREAIVLGDPENFSDDWWSLHYATEEWYDKSHGMYPGVSQFGTSVTKEICPEIESLRTGDRIIVFIENQAVIKVVKREE